MIISWLGGVQHVEWSKPQLEVKDDGQVIVRCGHIAVTGFDVADVPLLKSIIASSKG